jgi:hypothetical protein
VLAFLKTPRNHALKNSLAFFITASRHHDAASPWFRDSRTAQVLRLE